MYDCKTQYSNWVFGLLGAWFTNRADRTTEIKTTKRDGVELLFNLPVSILRLSSAVRRTEHQGAIRLGPTSGDLAIWL